MYKKLFIFFTTFMFLQAVTCFGAVVEYEGKMVSVTDGDTLVVKIPGFPAPYNPTVVRLNGIDTPESKFGPHGAKCLAEKTRGLEAKKWLKELLPPGAKVKVVWSGIHEMYGRLLGDIIIDGQSVADLMIKKNLAVRYDGGTKSKWCQTADK
jgi:micrococcal nuclease